MGRRIGEAGLSRFVPEKPLQALCQRIKTEEGVIAMALTNLAPPGARVSARRTPRRMP
jgi:hypothetical protein